MTELIAIGLVGAAGWAWFATLAAREAATEAARRACALENVQLLDDTVALVALRFERRASGRIAILRVYAFEFSDTGNNRLEGKVALLGEALHTLYLAPHREARERVPT